jgi:hypothetical protein
MTTVRVKTLRLHTHRGDEHQEGHIYEVDEADVDNLVAQRMVEVLQDDRSA